MLNALAILTVMISLITISLMGIALAILIGSSRIRRQATHPPDWPALIPSSQYIEVEGRRIHYVQSGTGPDLVLIHGIGASTFIWRYLFPLLQDRFRVTALDLPGFGRSVKDRGRDHGLDAQCAAVVEALDRIGISQATLVGSSMGGAIALWLAKTYPRRFAKVVTMAPATDHRLIPAISEWWKGLTPFFGWALNRHSMRVILSFVVKRRELISDDCIDAYLEPFKERESIHTFSNALELIRDHRLPGALAGLSSQVLVIYGNEDRMIPRSSMDLLLNTIPLATLRIHPRAGHHLMEDEPLWVAEQIRAFLDW